VAGRRIAQSHFRQSEEQQHEELQRLHELEHDLQVGELARRNGPGRMTAQIRQRRSSALRANDRRGRPQGLQVQARQLRVGGRVAG